MHVALYCSHIHILFLYAVFCLTVFCTEVLKKCTYSDSDEREEE